MPDGRLALQFLGGLSGWGFSYRNQISQPCPIEYSSMQADVLVMDTGYAGDSFAVFLDLHGVGTVASWYAHIGYLYRHGALSMFCHAFSHNSSTPRYWNEIGRTGWSDWHTFGIEVVPTDEGWHFAFRFLVDGAEVGYYQPPSKWDGDNRYRLQSHSVSIEGRADFDHPIEAFVDNFLGDSRCYQPVSGSP